MATHELAEAGLMVFKRILKWASLGLLALAVVGVCTWAGTVAFQKYQERPYRAAEYVGVKLGDSQDEVFYALGEPSVIIERRAAAANAKPWEAAPLVFAVKDMPEGKEARNFREWGYEKGEQHHWQVVFDAPKGKVTAVSCFSASTWNCPALFGLRDGSSEDDVRSQLGAPSLEELDGSVKRLRYPHYNLTVNLEKRVVTRLAVSEGARPIK